MLGVYFGPEWRRVVEALRREDKMLPKDLNNGLRKHIPAAVARAKAAVMRLPAPGPKHTGLRRRVSGGVDWHRTPVGYRITTSMNQPDESIIPLGLDRASGWRHPVYGNMNVWVQQRGYSWFRETIADHREEFQSGLTGALQNAAEDIADAGGTARPGLGF
jgi:hypothetical protein